jgi:hypothetical protein
MPGMPHIHGIAGGVLPHSVLLVADVVKLEDEPGVLRAGSSSSRGTGSSTQLELDEEAQF